MRELVRKLLRPHPEYIGFAMRGAYTALALLVSVLLARLLGPAPLGRYYEVVAWVLLVGTIVQNGWVPFLVREVAALREQRRYAELRGLIQLALRIVTAVSILAAATFILVSWLAADAETFRLFLIASPIVLLLSTSSLRQAITRGMGKPLLGVVCENLTRPGIQLIGLAVLASGLLAVRPTPSAALVVFLIAIAGSAVLALILQRAEMEETLNGEPALLPHRAAWLPSFLRTAVVGWALAINAQIGTIVVSWVSSDVEVAHFRVAQQLALLLAFGGIVVGSMYAKDYSRLFVRGDLRGVARLGAKGALISAATASAIGAVFLIGGQPLIVRVYGAAFAPVFAPLAIMILGQMVNATFGPVTAICIATRNEHGAMVAHLISVAINVLLCFALVPIWGAVGAATAASVSLTVWNVVLVLLLRRRLGINVFVGGDRIGRPGARETP
jgi:O-antigen/teichoic acid export membrane protein